MTATCNKYLKDEKGHVRWSTNEEKLAVLETAKKQYSQAYLGKEIDCTDCDRKFTLLRMFRCYYCGRYYCPVCAGNHFGGSRFK